MQISEESCSNALVLTSPSAKWISPVPECPVCWDLFDQELRSPRLIACGHTICEVCVGNLPLTRVSALSSFAPCRWVDYSLSVSPVEYCLNHSSFGRFMLCRTFLERSASAALSVGVLLCGKVWQACRKTSPFLDCLWMQVPHQHR